MMSRYWVVVPHGQRWARLSEFTSGPHGTARSSPFGQLLEITTGGCRPL
nr:MAG TPA: hypothetical protein [Caudoviricetes sp.]